MSDKRPFVSLNPRIIKKEYPKTWKSIKDWLERCATEGNLLTEEMIEAFIYGNPRFLYDYFDDMHIFISLKHRGYGEFSFTGGIFGDDTEGLFDSRKKAEEALFDYALKTQEAKL